VPFGLKTTRGVREDGDIMISDPKSGFSLYLTPGWYGELGQKGESETDLFDAVVKMRNRLSGEGNWKAVAAYAPIALEDARIFAIKRTSDVVIRFEGVILLGDHDPITFLNFISRGVVERNETVRQKNLFLDIVMSLARVRTRV
jgi:hypothetical protein